MNFIIKLRLWLLIIMALIVTSAFGQELVLDRKTMTINSDDRDFSLSITSDVDWRVISNQSWLTIKSNASGSRNGVVTLHASENTSYSERLATITVSGGGLSEVLIVTQMGVVPELTVSTTSLRYNPDGGTMKFNVTSNVEWTATVSYIDGSGWLTVTPTNKEPSDGGSYGEISVTTTANTGSSPRKATITISGGGLTQTVNVEQSCSCPPPQ